MIWICGRDVGLIILSDVPVLVPVPVLYSTWLLWFTVSVNFIDGGGIVLRNNQQ